jgi:hypothetical protein
VVVLKQPYTMVAPAPFNGGSGLGEGGVDFGVAGVDGAAMLELGADSGAVALETARSSAISLFARS